ncbi:Tetratricopeptide repeat-containing protein [Pseudarcicella hirudinis]|uniref:Tetratricopeptide repeat-containing protein n=1 Tax=Pseudarcicella hirudinis TaxID=1079859 RepID=A0A1I5QWB1_9BACT|nr:tetratricopeptide repeat protein [Pseudarcicella hirudinis]SFP50604.1 Tetratricopeptide repeat-containing protein [Pseudarcicella hirudinis]
MKSQIIRFLVILTVFIPGQNQANAQWWKATEDAEKERSKGMLLLTSEVQIEATNAINHMYNFKFYDAEREFNYLKVKYPDHPLPEFLLGLMEWWKIVPNTENVLYDERCLDYMDKSIQKAEKIWDDTENPEAAFFMAAAYAFKGRLHSERKHWTKATFAAKNALKYLDRSRNFADFSPELMFGDGLYNYYFHYVKENYPLLRPVLWLFPKGDKPKGIQQLEKVSYNAFYTRTEARYFLLQIYGMENMNDKAYDLARYTHDTYPDNPFFERYHARTAFVSGHMAEAEQLSKDILRKIDEHYAGYEGVSGRYATYILAYYAYNYNKDFAKAREYYQKTIEFAEQTSSTKSGYYLSSMIGLGKIAMQSQDYDKAIEYFKQVIDDSERKSAQREEAKKLLTEAKKARRKNK